MEQGINWDSEDEHSFYILFFSVDCDDANSFSIRGVQVDINHY